MEFYGVKNTKIEFGCRVFTGEWRDSPEWWLTLELVAWLKDGEQDVTYPDPHLLLLLQALVCLIKVFVLFFFTAVER